MRPKNRSTRREFVKITAGVAGLSVASLSRAVARPADADSALAKLVEGNKRFVNGQTSLLTRRRPEDFAALAEGQAPHTVIVGCSDSRVAPELIFDQGIGDLFVIRVAGNIVDGAGPSVKGSIEYAVGELGVRLILVMGHSKCGGGQGRRRAHRRQ